MTLKAPRKPLSAYNFFFQEERANLLGQDTIANEHADPKERKKRCHRRTHGKIGFTQLAKHVGQKWKSLDPEEKKVYQKKFQADKKRYAEELEKYEDDLSNMIHLAQVKKALKTLKQQEREKAMEKSSQSSLSAQPDTVDSNPSARRQDCYFNDVLDSAVSISAPSMMDPSLANFQFGNMSNPLMNCGGTSPFVLTKPPVVTSMYPSEFRPQNAQMKLQMLKQQEQMVRMQLEMFEQQQRMMQMKSGFQRPREEAVKNTRRQVPSMESKSDDLEPCPIFEGEHESPAEDSFEKMLNQLHDVEEMERPQGGRNKENVSDLNADRSPSPMGLPSLNTSLNLEWGSGEIVNSTKMNSLDTDMELLNFDFDDYLGDNGSKSQDDLNLDFLRESIYN